ncbi:MAG: hypothetical protein EOP42_19085 [Sphingobacteriaceae bacterium]|nr:MAG: hypothetical protein EOP42_19085 [Sphingobacteriaceae bacterium]
MNMEEKLWDYIDGFCTEDEQKAIRLLIETDENYHQKYLELKAFQENLASLEIEEPALNFTYNVMQSVKQEKILKPLQTVVDQRIVFGIAAFFIGCIVLLLGYVFTQINWHSSTQINVPVIKLPAINASFNSILLKGFLFFDLILGLFFADHYFRKLFINRK